MSAADRLVPLCDTAACLNCGAQFHALSLRRGLKPTCCTTPAVVSFYTAPSPAAEGATT